MRLLQRVMGQVRLVPPGDIALTYTNRSTPVQRQKSLFSGRCRWNPGHGTKIVTHPWPILHFQGSDPPGCGRWSGLRFLCLWARATCTGVISVVTGTWVKEDKLPSYQLHFIWPITCKCSNCHLPQLSQSLGLSLLFIRVPGTALSERWCWSQLEFSNVVYHNSPYLIWLQQHLPNQ